MDKIVFFRIAWMKEYKGVSKTDIPVGGGSYVAENNDGGETTNYLPINGKVYGYVRLANGISLRIEHLGANKNDDSIKNVTVVFMARDPHKGGEKIIGWYKNAEVFRTILETSIKQKSGRKIHYHAIASYTNATLLPSNT